MPAALALCLARGKVLWPYLVIERDELAVVDFRVHPDKGLLLAQQDALEPIALDLRHVAYQAMERQVRRLDWPTLEVCLIQAFTLEQKGDPVKLEPFLEHSPL